jgi:CNT family concentrative nucleoside transporter
MHLSSLLAEVSVPPGTIAQRAQSLLGLVVFTFLAFLIGRVRGARKIPWRVVSWGTLLQFAFGAIVIFSPWVLQKVQEIINQLLSFSNEGARMVFGELINYVLPVVNDKGESIGIVKVAGVFAFSVLPTIVFISMLTAILYHLGILTVIVHGLAWIMRKTMGTSGAETLSTAANIFVGQTEAPLIVKPFLSDATKSELMAIMVGGFANIATGVLVLYAGWLSPYVPNAGGHLALACFISAPATLIVAKLLMPETEHTRTAGDIPISVERPDANLIDAATRGTSEGLALALNVGAMLITFTALVALLNALIGYLGTKVGLPGLTMEKILGYILAPAAWLCGADWGSAQNVGALLGVKTVLNELIAYSQMKDNLASIPNYLSPRAALIATYALCGFANFASVGIQIGGISTLAPSRRADLSRIGLIAMVGGAIASCMGACVVGVLI